MESDKEIIERVNRRLGGTTIDSLIADGPFKNLLTSVAQSTTNNLENVILPIMTSCSGLMGRCKVTTHSGKNFSEKNILWTVTAAPTGKYKFQTRIPMLVFFARQKEIVGGAGPRLLLLAHSYFGLL